MINNPFQLIENRLLALENLIIDLKDQTRPETPKRYTVKEFADLTDSSPQTVRSWIKEGKVKAERIGRKLLISQSQFEEGLQEVKSLKYKR
jgi:excisionase family DNA binding protein